MVAHSQTLLDALFCEFKMAAKEVKSELKSARDAIQNKDYQTALKHCKV